MGSQSFHFSLCIVKCAVPHPISVKVAVLSSSVLPGDVELVYADAVKVGADDDCNMTVIV